MLRPFSVPRAKRVGYAEHDGMGLKLGVEHGGEAVCFTNHDAACAEVGKAIPGVYAPIWCYGVFHAGSQRIADCSAAAAPEKCICGHTVPTGAEVACRYACRQVGQERACRYAETHAGTPQAGQGVTVGSGRGKPVLKRSSGRVFAVREQQVALHAQHEIAGKRKL